MLSPIRIARDSCAELRLDILGGGPDAHAVAKPTDPAQLERHGTEMAGLLVGARGTAGLAGVAPAATVLPIRVAGWQPDEHGGDADEAVQQRDQFRHPGHLDAQRLPDADHGTDHHGDHEESDAGGGDAAGGQADGRGERDHHAADAEPDAALGRLVVGEAGEAEDEQQRSNDVGGLCSGSGGQCSQPPIRSE